MDTDTVMMIQSKGIPNQTTALLLLMIGICPLTAYATDEELIQHAIIAEPYLEIHTGPGRQYPIFYVAEEGERILLLKRRTGWYKVQLENGKEGWAYRREIEKTLLKLGKRKGLMDRVYDNLLENRLEMGWGTGTFGGDPTIRLRILYWVGTSIAFEFNAGFTSSEDESTDIYNGGIVLTPWETRWISLSGTVGGGYVQVTPESILIDAEEDLFPEAHAGFGFRIPLYKNLAINGDFRNYTFFNDSKRTQEFQEYTIGLSYRY